MQVDLLKPPLKPPRTQLLKLKCDILLSTAAFKFNLRGFMKDDKIEDDGERQHLEHMILNIETTGVPFKHDDLQVGPGRCSPRHRMPFDARNDGQKCVRLTCVADSVSIAVCPGFGIEASSPIEVPRCESRST